MRCEEIMKTGPLYVRPNVSVRECARKMRDHNVGFLPVCDKDDKVLGTITDRDIAIRVVSDDAPVDAPVERYMSSGDFAVCAPKDDLKRAQQTMGQKHVSRILVCDDQQRLVGVISLSDIAQFEDGSTAANTMRRVSEREARTH